MTEISEEEMGFAESMQRKLDAIPAELDAVLRWAREDAGLSVRELARRSGVSAGQVSRIENGKSLQPNFDTIGALASALGRSYLALGCLAGDSEAIASLSPDELDQAPGWVRDRWPAERVGAWITADELDEREVLLLARDLFVGSDLRAALEHQVDYRVRYDLQYMATRLLGVDERRRDMIRGYVDDQLRLSELDRLRDERGEVQR